MRGYQRRARGTGARWATVQTDRVGRRPTGPGDNCGDRLPTVYGGDGWGYGRGAVADVAAVAGDYPAVKKILLIAPSGDAGTKNIVNGLAKFHGTVSITAGDRDRVVGAQGGERLMGATTGTEAKQLVIVPDCDHQFQGRRNGMILSKAPGWAFWGDMTYPSPDGGTVLY